jgi:hypothetical protein
VRFRCGAGRHRVQQDRRDQSNENRSHGYDALRSASIHFASFSLA